MSQDVVRGWLLIHPNGMIAVADGTAAALLGAASESALVGTSWEALVEVDGRRVLGEIARGVRYGLGWSGSLVARGARGPISVQVEASGVGGAIALAVSARPAPAAAEGLPSKGRAHTAEGATERLAPATLEAAAQLIDATWAALVSVAPAAPAAATARTLTLVDCTPGPIAGLAPGVAWDAPDSAERAVIESGEPARDRSLTVHRGDASPLARLPAYGMRSALRVPLFVRDRVVGLAIAYSTRTDAFSREEALRFEEAVRHLGGDLDSPSTLAASAPATESEAAPPDAVADRLDALRNAIAGIAHELNNPLAAVAGYAQALPSLSPAEQQHALGVIEAEALRAGAVVRDLLLFGQRQPPELVPLDLGELVGRVLDGRRAELERAGIEIERELPPLPPVEGDARQLEEVVAQLVDNARLEMTAGGVLRVRAGLAGPEEETVRLTVEDTGSGVPPRARGRVFEPFFTTRDGRGGRSGRGLGLAVVYGVVASHGGRAWVEAAPQGGARFVVELPSSTRPAPPAPSGVPSGAASETPARPAPTRILVVDDEESLRALATQVLGSFGYEVMSAPSAEAALTLLETQPFDAVLSDIRMPGMDGVALHAEIARRWPDLARRVVIMTGDVENEAVARLAREAGLIALEKPFRLDALRDAFAKVLGESPGR